jgi:hypothetical protein
VDALFKKKIKEKQGTREANCCTRTRISPAEAAGGAREGQAVGVLSSDEEQHWVEEA